MIPGKAWANAASANMPVTSIATVAAIKETAFVMIDPGLETAAGV